MLTGMKNIPQVTEESTCRSSKEYRFTDTGIYKVHSNALMPNITFEEGVELPDKVDKSIFLNDKDTELSLPDKIKTQNYLTTRFIGRAPLEFYSGDQKTEIGRQFIMRCVGNKPSERYRVFGTEEAIRGFNKDASDQSQLPGGGEE